VFAKVQKAFEPLRYDPSFYHYLQQLCSEFLMLLSHLGPVAAGIHICLSVHLKISYGFVRLLAPRESEWPTQV